jgi:hypothetical protein
MDIGKRFFHMPLGWKQIVFFGDAKFNHASKGNRPSPNITMRNLAFQLDGDLHRFVHLGEYHTSQVASCCLAMTLTSKGA